MIRQSRKVSTVISIWRSLSHLCIRPLVTAIAIQLWSSTLILKCPRLTFYWCRSPTALVDHICQFEFFTWRRWGRRPGSHKGGWLGCLHCLGWSAELVVRVRVTGLRGLCELGECRDTTEAPQPPPPPLSLHGATVPGTRASASTGHHRLCLVSTYLLLSLSLMEIKLGKYYLNWIEENIVFYLFRLNTTKHCFKFL